MNIRYLLSIIVIALFVCDMQALVNVSDTVPEKKTTEDIRKELLKKKKEELVVLLLSKESCIDSLKLEIEVKEKVISEVRDSCASVEMSYQDKMKKYWVKDDFLSNMSDSERKNYCVRLTKEPYNEERVNYAMELCDEVKVEQYKKIFQELKKLLGEYKTSRDSLIEALKEIDGDKLRMIPSEYQTKSEKMISEKVPYYNERYNKRNEKGAYFIKYLDDIIEEILKRIETKGTEAKYDDLIKKLKGE